ncbi:MAG: ABC transporter permease [Candidatus Brocadiaceae bacterium]|nr:ABC transporter permease [Candidatus Brocadiaceae bacterium]
MFSFTFRRVVYFIPVIILVNLLTFFLFFILNPPDMMAKKILGDKNVTPAAIEKWKRDHSYHLPRVYNSEEKGFAKITQTIFVQKSARLLKFDFGKSDRNNLDIGKEIRQRMVPSLTITVPMLFLSLIVCVSTSLIVAFYRGTYVDLWALVLCVFMMSISMLFYIIGGQFIFGKLLKLFPISGYESGLYSWKFVFLPVVVGVISGIGASVRFYRTIFLEEINRDYIRTARSKGLSEVVILFKHCLKNAMIPLLTNIVMSIPFLFMGSFLLEIFFGIPGLGNFTIEAIDAQDFAIVRSMVFLGSLLYIVGLILTDISYTLVDPRIRFE